MKFLYQPFNAKAKDRVVVKFNKPTRVMLIHENQLKKYKGGRTYQYRGGFSKDSQVDFEVPYEGKWFAVIEKGPLSAPIDVQASAKLHKPKFKTLNGPVQNETHEAITEYDDTLE